MKKQLLTLLAMVTMTVVPLQMRADDIPINGTTFPDANFRNWVLAQDYGQDGVLTEAEIAGVTSMYVSNKNIASLKGIEYFTALTDLRCGGNQLTSLDVSKNTALEDLRCHGNQLTSLDVSGCTALLYIDCESNQLTSLDVSSCTALSDIDCHSNQLTSLDVSSCMELWNLECYSNLINETEMGKLIESLPTVSNGWFYAKSLKDTNERNIISPAQVTAAKAKGWTTFAIGLGNSGVEYGGDGAATGIEINETTFPDAKFRKWVYSQYYGQDGILTEAEIANVKRMDVNEKNIASLKGVEYFTALTELNCGYNQLTSLDVSKNTALTKLSCRYNQLTSLDVSSCTALKELDCQSNQMTSLDVSGCTALTTLWCSENQLTSLNVSKNTALKELYCYSNQLTALDASGCTALEVLQCYSNQLASLKVSGCTALMSLDCHDNQLTSLDMSGCTALEVLNCYSNQLTSLDVSGCTALGGFSCSFNQLTSLKVSGCTALGGFSCSYNQLTSLDVSGCTALWSIKCCSNRINETEMGKLVESLPTKYGYLTVKNLDDSNDQNVITITQVTAAKAKGWAVYAVDANGDEVIYHGVETSLNSITTGATGSTIDHYYTLDGVRHEGEPTQKGVYIVKDKKVAIK